MQARCDQRQDVITMKQAKKRSEAENYKQVIGQCQVYSRVREA